MAWSAYARRDFKGNVSYTDTLASGINNSQTTITLASGTTFPTGSQGPFVVTIDPGLSTEEKVLVTSRSGATLTVDTRGFESTTAQAHSSGASVLHTISKTDLDEANYAVSKTVGVATTAGDVLVADAANSFKRLGLSAGAAYKVIGQNSGGTDLTYLDSLASILTTQGDMPYASLANTPARLAIGAAATFMRSNGTTPAWAVPTGVFYTVHTWAISGSIAVPSGDTDFLVPMFASKGANETVVLDKVRYVINSGTSVTFKMQVNGSDATGFTGISCTSTAATTDPADVTLADLDKLVPVVTAVSGSPKNMTVTAFLKHTLTVS